MRTEDLLDAIGNADDELLERSERAKIKRRSYNPWIKWIPIAACLCVGIIGLVRLSDIFFMTANDGDSASIEGNAMQESTDGAEIMGGTSEEDALAADSDGAAENSSESKIAGYAGAIYPLTVAQTNEYVTAVRDITLDFESSETEMSVQVDDSYTLYNDSDEDIELQLFYPYEAENGGYKAILRDGAGKRLETTDSERTIESFTGDVVEAKVTVPAKGSMIVTATQYKISSLYHEYQDLFGYRVVTKLGENLKITEMWATLLDSDALEIEKQNCGFDLDAGEQTVELDLDVDEYYFEVNSLLW